MEKTVSIFFAFLSGFLFSMLRASKELDFLELPVVLLNIAGLLIMIVFGSLAVGRAIKLLRKEE